MNMTTYIRVSEEEGGECIEIPVEDDGTLFLSTLVAQFPGACGLKYRNPDTKSLRGVKVIEDRLICPDEGWIFDFICTFPKLEFKRKSSDILESSASTKTKKLDIYDRCTDLIVLDLPWKTTEKELQDYFTMFGSVVMAQLKKDPKTGQSRGYGFIRFDDLEVQKQVLATRHSIGGRRCDVRVPKSKDPDNPYLSSKIFVGRITEDFTEQDIRDYFGQFGEVTYVFIPKKPFRAFSFVQFIEPRAAMEVCEQKEHLIKGVTVSVSSAKQRKEPPKVPGRDTNYNGMEGFVSHSGEAFDRDATIGIGNHTDTNFASHGGTGFSNHSSTGFSNHSSTGFGNHNNTGFGNHGSTAYGNHNNGGLGIYSGGSCYSGGDGTTDGYYNTSGGGRRGDGGFYGHRGVRGKKGGEVGGAKRHGGVGDGNLKDHGGWSNTGRGGMELNLNALAADVVAALTQQLGVMGPPPAPHHHHY